SPTLPPLPVNLEGLDISSQGNVIKVSLAGLLEAVADQVQSLPNVTKVAGYLIVATPDYPNPIIGMEPDSALRVEDTIVTLAVGKSFQSRNGQVAIPGLNLNSNPYTSGDGMTGMAHTFRTGQSFSIKGTRLRVVGLFRAPDENAILVPLGTAQQIFGMGGQLTTLFVTVDSQKNIDQVTAEIQRILGAR
ncbi:MAG: ABC transporter permease, partial [Proteobacteria bacterium]|nr:ABC transporter permease [Pseudomonadota bacterium]